eukprot:jgi/Pico_ML_1/52019/g2797.t1
MFGHFGTSSSSKDGGTGGNIDGACTVSTGSYDIQHVVSGVHCYCSRLHAERKSGDFVRSFTFGTQQHQESSDLGGVCVVQDCLHVPSTSSDKFAIFFTFHRPKTSSASAFHAP